MNKIIQDKSISELINEHNIICDELRSRGVSIKKINHHYVGERIGALTIIEEIGKEITESGWYKKWYKCRCDCGKEMETTGQYLYKCKTIQSCKTCRHRGIYATKKRNE